MIFGGNLFSVILVLFGPKKVKVFVWGLILCKKVFYLDFRDCIVILLWILFCTTCDAPWEWLPHYDRSSRRAGGHDFNSTDRLLRVCTFLDFLYHTWWVEFRKSSEGKRIHQHSRSSSGVYRML